MSRILEAVKPEAAYFTEQGGKRGAVVVADMANASQIPALSEPWFLTFNAAVELKVCMTPQDLEKAGLEELGKKYGQRPSRSDPVRRENRVEKDVGRAHHTFGRGIGPAPGV